MSNDPETGPISWWEVDAEIRRQVDQHFPPGSRATRLDRQAKYEEMARSLLAYYLRTGRPTGELLAEMVEQRIISLDLVNVY